MATGIQDQGCVHVRETTWQRRNRLCASCCYSTPVVTARGLGFKTRAHWLAGWPPFAVYWWQYLQVEMQILLILYDTNIMLPPHTVKGPKEITNMSALCSPTKVRASLPLTWGSPIASYLLPHEVGGTLKPPFPEQCLRDLHFIDCCLVK